MEARFVRPAKTKLRQLWESKYKSDIRDIPRENTPDAPAVDYLENLFNRVAPVNIHAPPRPNARRDQLTLYLEEPPTAQIGVMEYWRSREREWPELASMAFDFLAIPAMSSECERVFSSCSHVACTESSRLLGEMLWHSECFKNWQRRGAIYMASYQGGLILDFGGI